MFFGKINHKIYFGGFHDYFTIIVLIIDYYRLSRFLDILVPLVQEAEALISLLLLRNK